MKKIKLLDCTLRDGGSLNGWMFGADNILSLYNSLNESGIDIVEIGFIDNNVKDNINSALKSSISEFDNIKIENKKCKCCAMVDISKYDTSKFNFTRSKNIDAIRIMFKKELLNSAADCCVKLKELGYQVSLNPVSVTRYNEKEFLNLIEKSNNIKPNALYIVDTYGLMSQEETVKYFNLADKYLREETEIGYHIHNSMQTAVSNSINIINQDTKRTLIIDSSLYGMGKRAGNTQTEVIAQYLNKNFNKNYDIDKLIKTAEERIIPLKETCEWGYSLVHFIAAKNKCNSDYSTYFYKEKMMSLDEINCILKNFEEEKKLIFNKKYADFIAQGCKKC